ncbi:MAG: urea carboxylase-associated family protein [Alphaproteobacteria bacterium]|nr:urea carboxylase-associated family protein [Rhodospirillaceae bacterium]MDG2480294.1 urea carboxylase-associated family protein [Alphaproteobacteria bacterium]MBT6203489.1 urea carboxylase-associated family protein [Rhodospirillaceae bacterium]MBT6512850.1 urea carboxylase-associated family protein [Rhodospirillaceae bacterium]MBT7614936.1 urea carboxylase-associated family protein [Rhodospirillaceae bacterium]
MTQLLTVPAAHGLAVPLQAGASLRVVNTPGTQVVDTWAFPDGVDGEFLSMEHCREVLQRIVFEPGDMLVTNRYRPLLEITGDTSPGGHDTLIAACSAAMYRHAGAGDDHANCADNLAAALAGHGRSCPGTPAPWNLFMQAPVIDGHRIAYVRPTAKPGDYVAIKALMDCLMVFSACPDDVYPTNGGDGTPRDVLIELD